MPPPACHRRHATAGTVVGVRIGLLDAEDGGDPADDYPVALGEAADAVIGTGDDDLPGAGRTRRAITPVGVLTGSRRASRP